MDNLTIPKNVYLLINICFIDYKAVYLFLFSWTSKVLMIYENNNSTLITHLKHIYNHEMRKTIVTNEQTKK